AQGQQWSGAGLAMLSLDQSLDSDVIGHRHFFVDKVFPDAERLASSNCGRHVEHRTGYWCMHGQASCRPGTTRAQSVGTPHAVAAAMPTTPAGASHYAVLGLPGPAAGQPRILNRSDLKAAYHRALLRHHPDKAAFGTSAKPSATVQSGPNSLASANGTRADKKASYSIDQITTAYKVLSDPASRAEYDRRLRLGGAATTTATGLSGPSAGDGDGDGDGDGAFHIGMELYDLDDMTLEEGAGPAGTDLWWHACRCGEARGFAVSEHDLEREAEWGEVVVGCRGCSLWAKVTFAVGEE
ncbi:hypothetical protein KEM52_006453, partial [Ascosphaera acerosa]